ncbi:hypothetical protein [Paenibacillus larvae]|uniref:Uncharacterized protein n=1 Tax=Paenibacillus larvae subsp. larvae DSM 25430 TaxID=697284 RepID=V9W9V7_9BACL|nr:hypothetical protein [Paenibacillus larvae]AHD06495.1 hypothetical protein ERIC2_c27080 [Paenibacillus larvae subsp. larvae DSM 25430]AVG13048.1 hypothetical protein ERICII_02694 [Paenibacillus larvae subsp. larvae DSM 25430]MDR5596761.1 hypothetical protein [Paenibacillus larvae]
MASKKIDIRLTENFRLRADDRNFIIMERRFTDPTRSPNWEGLKKNGKSPEPRETWRDSGYYPLGRFGLTAAIEEVIVREGNNRGNAAGSLGQLLLEYRKVATDVYDTIERCWSELGVPRYFDSEN